MVILQKSILLYLWYHELKKYQVLDFLEWECLNHFLTHALLQKIVRLSFSSHTITTVPQYLQQNFRNIVSVIGCILFIRLWYCLQQLREQNFCIGFFFIKAFLQYGQISVVSLSSSILLYNLNTLL